MHEVCEECSGQALGDGAEVTTAYCKRMGLADRARARRVGLLIAWAMCLCLASSKHMHASMGVGLSCTMALANF